MILAILYDIKFLNDMFKTLATSKIGKRDITNFELIWVTAFFLEIYFSVTSHITHHVTVLSIL